MSKHTPGPWNISESVNGEGFGVYNINADGYCIATVDRSTPPHQEDKPNARLIAAAPKMLELILEFVESPDHDSLDHEKQVFEILESVLGDECPNLSADMYRWRVPLTRAGIMEPYDGWEEDEAEGL